MDYKLAKELKGAGFPKIITFSRHNDDVEPEYYIFGVPDLSELIEACGDEIEGLIRSTDLWTATQFQAHGGQKINIGQGKTPEEAVAKLWLALNK